MNILKTVVTRCLVVRKKYRLDLFKSSIMIHGIYLSRQREEVNGCACRDP